MNSSKKLLLAGAGDLCQRTAPLMAASGVPSWGVRRTPPSISADPNITWVAADLKTIDRAVLPEGITHVLYAPTPDRRTPDNYRDVFVAGLSRLLDQLDSDRLQRVVFVSSTAVYGDNENWITEQTVAAPEQFNGEILLEAEQYLKKRLPGRSVCLRLSGLYGPGRTTLLDRLREGRVSIPGTGAQWANRIHIDDAARACAHLLTHPDPMSTYIGSDSRPYPVGELYRALASMLNAPAPSTELSTAQEQDSMSKNGRPAKNTIRGKRVSNARLLQSGFTLLWPDAMKGYQALINTARANDAAI